ncbi:unnamed protein product, partial [marine sediment metagenome]
GLNSPFGYEAASGDYDPMGSTGGSTSVTVPQHAAHKHTIPLLTCALVGAQVDTCQGATDDFGPQTHDAVDPRPPWISVLWIFRYDNSSAW